MNQSGVYLIPIAFPEALASSEGMWYHRLLGLSRISNNGYVRAGHAALALVDVSSREVFYADFGRYITPRGYGRVRSRFTDPEVRLDVQASFGADGQLANLDEILRYLYHHPEKTHGAGALYASCFYSADGERARQTLRQWKDRGLIPYGPFRPSNTNCSRFVRSFMMDCIHQGHERWQAFQWSRMLTPSTLSNVKAGAADDHYYRVADSGLERLSVSQLRDDVLQSVFRKPKQAPAVANHHKAPSPAPSEVSHWLGGTGSGAWFELRDTQEDLASIVVARVEPDGEEIFERRFRVANGSRPTANQKMHVVHGSNAEVCYVRQGSHTYIYKVAEGQ